MTIKTRYAAVRPSNSAVLAKANLSPGGITRDDSSIGRLAFVVSLAQIKR